MVNPANRMWIWVKTMYLRITLTKTTLIFFLFSFLLCFTHALVQSFLFSLDASAHDLTSAVITAAEVPLNEFAWLTRRHNGSEFARAEMSSTTFTVQMCKAVPMEKAKDDNPCDVIFESGAGLIEVPAGFRRRAELTLPSGSQSNSSASNFTQASNGITSATPAGHFIPSIGAFVQPMLSASSGNVSGVQLTKKEVNSGQAVLLDEQCTRVMVYADQVLKNSKREELALIGSEFWLFGISVFAIMYDSIPHLLAALAFRVLSAGWSAYAIWRTRDIDLRFRVLITDGACGVNLFPGYFKMRLAVQIPELVINVLALALLCYLVLRLVRAYATFMFKRVGAPDHVVKIYRYFLSVFTCLQLSVYLLVASTALWVDQLVNGAIASISSHTGIYLGLFVFTLAALIPWLMTGWFAVRLERRRTLLAFLAIAAVYLSCWAIMYYSLVFRWTWLQWPFFACLTVAAQLVLAASIILGTLSRRNFGRGLKQYLLLDAALEKEDFEPEMFDNDTSFSSMDSTEKQRPHERNEGGDGRLSQTLDFGAHQPPPPMSPPAHGSRLSPVQEEIAPLPPAVRNPVSRVNPLSRVTPPASGARPQSFTLVLPTLPMLGKNDPWKPGSLEKGDDYE